MNETKGDDSWGTQMDERSLITGRSGRIFIREILKVMHSIVKSRNTPKQFCRYLKLESDEVFRPGALHPACYLRCYLNGTDTVSYKSYVLAHLNRLWINGGGLVNSIVMPQQEGSLSGSFLSSGNVKGAWLL